MHFTRRKLKPTKQITKNFSTRDALKGIEVPERSKQFSRNYYKSKKVSDKYGLDMLLEFENSDLYTLDYLDIKNNIIIPKLNPTTIIYSNAIMFHTDLMKSKENLLKRIPKLKEINKQVEPKIFGTFFFSLQ